MNRRLTVIQLLPALESGGVERSTLEIAAALVAAGHRAIVVCAGGRLLPALHACGGEHIAMDIGRKSPASLRHVPALRRLLLETGAHIVHARSRLPAWLGRITLATLPQARRPHWVTTVHGLNSPSRYSAVMASGERVICVSGSVRAHVLQHYPRTDPQCLRVIPRGIDPALFPRRAQPDPAARAAVAQLHPALAGDGPLLLLPGRGTRLKGHADALELLATLRAGPFPGARLWLPGARAPGREAYLRELEGRAASAGMADAVLFTAPTADIAQAYAAADLVLQLSRKPEAFGRTVIEALAVGRPVLGWAHGGVGELLASLQPQGAVAPFDEQALAATATNLLRAPPPPPSHVGFSLQAMQHATLDLYAELAH